MLFHLTSVKSQVKIGAFGGFNLSRLKGDVPPDTKYQTKVGGNFGFIVDIPLKEKIHISIQPSYSQEGTKIFFKEPQEYEHTERNKVKLNYYSLPILLKVSTENNRFYATGGIETSYLNHSSQTPIDEEQQVLGVDITDWNFSLDFGAGMRIPIGTVQLFLEARYAHGLNNITKDPIVNELIPRVKTSNIRFLTGIEIPLKK